MEPGVDDLGVVAVGNGGLAKLADEFFEGLLSG